MLTALLEILQNRSGDIITATVDHIQLTLIALVLANLIAIPLGVLLTRYRRWAELEVQSPVLVQPVVGRRQGLEQILARLLIESVGYDFVSFYSPLLFSKRCFRSVIEICPGADFSPT